MSASSSSRIPKLPPTAPRSKAGWELFADGLHTILTKWDILRSAVTEEWGGPSSREKAVRLADDLLMNCEEQWRDGHDIHEDSLDDFFIDCLENDFNVDFEDDRMVTEVSLVIQDFYRKCANGDMDGARTVLDTLDKHEHLSGKPLPRGPDVEAGDDSEGDSEGEDGHGASAAAAAPPPEPRAPKRVVDEEGWETIVPTRKRGGGAPAAAPAAAAAAAPPASAAPAPAAGDSDSD